MTPASVAVAFLTRRFLRRLAQGVVLEAALAAAFALGKGYAVRHLNSTAPPPKRRRQRRRKKSPRA